MLLAFLAAVWYHHRSARTLACRVGTRADVWFARTQMDTRTANNISPLKCLCRQ